MTGHVCRHCQLDTCMLAWEMRLFAVHTRALAAGSVVTAEEALRQARLQLLPTAALSEAGMKPAARPAQKANTCTAGCWALLDCCVQPAQRAPSAACGMHSVGAFRALS